VCLTLDLTLARLWTRLNLCGVSVVLPVCAVTSPKGAIDKSEFIIAKTLSLRRILDALKRVLRPKVIRFLPFGLAFVALEFRTFLERFCL